MLGKKKALFGLDIGSSSIKAVEIKRTKSGLKLVHFGMIPLPSEAIVDGTVMNSTAVVDAITELIERENIKTKNVALSIAGHSVIIKKISLPQMSEEDLEESIQWEAEQYIPFDINDVNIDVQILSTDESDVGQMDVVLVAAKKDVINDYTAVVQEAGLKPVIMDIDCFAVENMFEANYEVPLDRTVVLVNIGASLTNINVLRRGISTFTRDINMGGNQFTEEIQKQLNVNYEEAEALKLGGELGGATETTEAVIPQEVGGIIRNVSETVAGEIKRSLDFFGATSVDDRISKIYLCGGSSRIPGLTSIIENKVGVPVEIINPFLQIEIDEKVHDSGYLNEIAPMAAVGVGLALRWEGDR